MASRLRSRQSNRKREIETRCHMSPLQLHADLSVYPKFWGYQVFIYSGYCHLPLSITFRRIHERNSFDLGAICLFCFEFCCLIDFLIPIVT